MSEVIVTETMRIAGFESKAFDEFADKIRNWPLTCKESADLCEAIYRAMDAKRERAPGLEQTIKALLAIQTEALETLGEPSHKWRGGINHIARLTGEAMNALPPDAEKLAARLRTIENMKRIVLGGIIAWATEIVTDEDQYRRAMADCLTMMGEKALTQETEA